MTVLAESDPGEPVTATAVRELKEETVLSADRVVRRCLGGEAGVAVLGWG
jgi:hypothetical protein